MCVLKFFGFFPTNFGGKYREFKKHLYNFLVSTGLITAFVIVGVSQLSMSLISTTENKSVLGYLTALIEVLSLIIFFAIIKIYLVVKSEAQQKYFEKLRDLEVTVRSHYARNKKIDKINKDLQKSILRQEILLFVFYILIELSYDYVSVAKDVLMHTIRGILYDLFNCFFVQILIFLKMNMNFVRRLQNHLNQVLANLEKSGRHFHVDDFIKIHNKIKQCLEALNEAFGFIFLLTFVAIYGSMIPEIYKSILTLAQSNSKISMNLLTYIILNFTWASFSYYHLGKFALECDLMKEEVLDLYYTAVFLNA